MDWLSSVGQLRREMVALLADLATVLGTTRAHLVTLDTQSADLITAQGQASAGVEHIPALATGLARALGHWTTRMDQASTRASIRDTRMLLGELSRIRVFFQFLSTITSIQVARDRSDQLTAFVEDLRAMPVRIEAELSQVQANVGEFDRSFEAILGVARSGSNDLAAAADLLTDQLAPISAAERQMAEGRRQITGLARQVSGRTQTAVGQLVRAFQFSDSAAQRLEHVEAILAAGPGNPAFALLAAAQILALAEDAGEILAVLDSSFRSIEDIGGGFLSALASQRAASAKLLAQQDQAAARAQSVLGELAPVLTHIVSHAEGFESRIGTIRTRLRTLEGIGQTVNLAAVNAYIKAARATTGRQELTYIAMSVKEHANLALRTLAETARGLDQLRTSLDAAEYGEMRQAMADLEGNLGALAEGLAQSRLQQEAMAALEDGIRRETLLLAELAEGGRAKTAGVARLIERIAALGVAIRAELPASADTRALAELESLYTMAREREVHAALTGVAPAEEAAQDSLDDILF